MKNGFGKRFIAAALSAALPLSALSPVAAQAQQVSVGRTPSVSVVPMLPPSLPVLPVSAGLTPSVLPLSAVSSLPSFSVPAAAHAVSFSVPSAVAVSAVVPKAVTPAAARVITALSVPSEISALPASASGESFGRAAESDFARRLGEETIAASESPVSAAAPLSVPSQLTRASASSESKMPREDIPAPAERQNRNALAPLWLAGVSGLAWLGLQAANWSATGAGNGIEAVGVTGLGIAAATVLVLTGAFVLNAAVDAVVFTAAMIRGRNVGEEDFRAFVRREVMEGRLDANAAALIKPYRPEKFGGPTFAFAARGAIWLRPELAAWPWLFRKVMIHELSHHKARFARGPPKRGALGLLSAFTSEIAARAAEFKSGASLKNIRVPALERALREAQISLKRDRPYDILVLNPAAKELEDPKLYRGLSGGVARVTSLRSAEPNKALEEASAGKRFEAVVLGAASAVLPAPKSRDALRLDATLKQLDSLHSLATRLTARGDAFAGTAEAKEWAGLIERASRLRAAGSKRALQSFEEEVRKFWREISASRLKGVALPALIERLYSGLEDRGTAFLSFAADEPGAAVWERLLRYWEAEDGGKFRATRVDLEDGGHILILRKIESRVGLWLRPIKGGHIERSIPNASRGDEGRAAAQKTLEDAGFGEQLKLFAEYGVSVRHVFGADLGRQEIYVTVPRRHSAAIRKYVTSASIQVESSKTDFEPHLMDSAGLMGVKPVWQLGVTGAGGSILWVDTGLDASHPDFGDRLEAADMVNEGPEDWLGHGTHVAGISASGDSVFTGMAKAAKGIMAKVFSREQPGASDGEIMASAALAQKKGSDVVSLSLGSRGTSSDNLAEFFSQLTRQKNSAGELPIVTASAGNSGPFDRTLSQPAAGVDVLAVAAAAKSLDDGVPEIAFFSSVGPDVDRRYAIKRWRFKPEITGIGGDVTTEPGSNNVYKHGVYSAKSKDAGASPSDMEDGKRTGMSGTSMSNPAVAGIALLLKLSLRALGALTPSRDGKPSFVADNLPFVVKALLMASSRDMGVPIWFQGAGLVDAEAAVKLASQSAGRELRSGFKGLLARFKGTSFTADEGGWGWAERLKAVVDAEDAVFREAELAKSEALSRAEETGEGADSEVPPEERSAAGNAVQTEVIKRFNAARDAVLPKILEALKDSSWLVRQRAALVLLNLRSPAATLPLAEVALNDADARVRQAAFFALAETPTHAADMLLRKAAAHPSSDIGAYAAYALARRGDRSGVARLIAESVSADKRSRFAAAWLLGQIGATPAEAEALSARVKDAAERGNVRHLAAASLGNLAGSAPESISDRVITDLLETAGPENLALTRTVQKFFPIAIRQKSFIARLREEPLKTIVTGFVTRNKGAIQRPGALSELVQLLARVVNVPLDFPTPPMDPTGAGVTGVDLAVGPADLIVELPDGRSLADYRDENDAEGLAAALSGLGLDASLLMRFEASGRATLPLSRALWLSVPAHKLYAFTLALEHRGFSVRRSIPVYPLARGSAATEGAAVNLSADGVLALTGEDLSLVRVSAAEGVSEARALAGLELVARRVAGKGPTVVALTVGAPTARRTALSVLVDRLVAAGVGVVVGAGNGGPRIGTVASPGDAKLAVVVAAAGTAKGLQDYSGRGTVEAPRVTWTDIVDDADPLAAAAVGAAIAAERTAAKLAALARALAAGFAARGLPLPQGWFPLIARLVKQSVTPMPAHAPHEVGAGLFDDANRALELLRVRLLEPEATAREAEALAAAAKARVAPAPLPVPPAGLLRRVWNAVRSVLPGGKGAKVAETLALAGALTLADAFSPEPATRAEVKALKRALGDGSDTESGRVTPFAFKTATGWSRARSAGLEGFVYSKRELMRSGTSVVGQLEDQFKYLDALLAPVESASAIRAALKDLRASSLSVELKDRRLDELAAAALDALRARLREADQSLWGRRNATYMIFARAYNRLREGKNFFDSLDDQELKRIKAESTANEVWLMDIFEIGEVNRWGTGGGSSYSIKGYRVKPELGGDAGLKAFVARAHRADLKVKLDFIPNHFSLDSDMVKSLPEGFFHILPPQELSDEQIMAAVPRESWGNHAPIYKLVTTDSYPFPDGRRPARVLIHHPRTDYGNVMWVDLAQIDYSRPEARAWMIAQLERLFTEFGVDSVRRDMAYEILNSRYYHRWLKILEDEKAGIPAGWARDGHQAVIDGLKARWEALKGAEFMEEAADAVKSGRPQAVMIDEAYAHADDLSRAGSDGIYNKADFDLEQGQTGLYDAMVSRDGGRIRAALRNAAFRRWQIGGAPLVNFIGTHDGGEGNPFDKFGRQFKAAALTALMLRPILFYNGLEQGVGQRENLIGDLTKSVDTEKAIPYDIPVKINWENANEERRAWLKTVLAAGERHQQLLDSGAMEVLEPASGGESIAAWTVGSADSAKFLLVAANWSGERSAGTFRFGAPLLKGFGAFVPRADRRYLLRDLMDLDANGVAKTYERDGRELIEKGLYVEIDAGSGHLFEVDELP